MTDLNPSVIAAHARRFSLLADRPNLLYPDREQRTERILSDDTKGPLDVMLVGGADEADRVCAAGVVALRGDAPQAKPVLSLLSVLPAERLLGVYFALPSDRRGQCTSDPVWAYHLRRAPDGVEAAASALRGLAEADVPELLLEAEEAADFRHFSNALLRRSLGMSAELSDAEEAFAAAGEAALAEVLADGD